MKRRKIEVHQEGRMSEQGILELLKERPIVGDGSYVFTLEKRGYVKGGPWTPEAVVEYPDGVRELHKEYLRAGADVLQAFSFYATDGKIQVSDSAKPYTSELLNQAACDIVKEVASTSNVLVCGGVSPTPTFKDGKGDKASVQAEFRKQAQIFLKNKADFLLAEFLIDIVEAEWAIETLKETGLPVACTMRIGPTGDINNVSPAKCSVRMAKAGADIVGQNCQYGPPTCIKTMKLMKEGLDQAGLSPFLMIQPNGFMCPEVENAKGGYHELPEYPFALEPRLITRWDARRFAREAYDLGVRYIGGCCGCEPYHIREMAEELAEERGFRPLGQDKNLIFGAGMKENLLGSANKRHGRDYWMNLVPATGRPDSPAASTSDSLENNKK